MIAPKERHQHSRNLALRSVVEFLSYPPISTRR